jgi:hypothetical protein
MRIRFFVKGALAPFFMFNSFVCFLLIFCFTSLNAQTLGYSQTVLVSNSIQTVPANKVWKVESFLPTTSKVTSTFPTAFNLVVNGSAYPVGHSAFGNVSGNNAEAWSSSMVNTSFPFWLPAGSTLAAGTGIGLISVIEFSVIP